MSADTILLIVLVVGGLGAILFLMNKKFAEISKNKPEDEKSTLMLQQQLNQLSQTLDKKLSEVNQTAVGQSSANTKVIQNISKDNQDQVGKINKQLRDVTERLTKLDETNRQVMGFSEQLNSLEKVLKSQKQRGNLGEAGLKLVLENMLPPDAFSLQYKFDDGDIVDAAIFTKDGIIPVDAKFSLENYNRIVDEVDDDRRAEFEKSFKNDLKKRIDETSKYVKPNKGTLDFAFMFIPAEAIYYDLLVNEVGAVKVNTRNLIDYASNERKVIIVSPTTFSAYLKTVLFGLQALKIEEQAKEIKDNVEKLGKHLNAYESFHQKVGGSLSTTVNHYNRSFKELKKVDKDVMKITEGDSVLKLEDGEVDRPKVEDLFSA